MPSSKTWAPTRLRGGGLGDVAVGGRGRASSDVLGGGVRVEGAGPQRGFGSEGQTWGRGPASTACLSKQGRGPVLGYAGMKGKGETEARIRGI